MKSKLLIAAAVLLMGVSAGAWADDGAEATIRLMGTAEAERPDAVTKKISLPDHLLVKSEDQVATVEKAKGHDKANERLDKREKGLTQADAAREQGADMSEKARENREARGRSEERPGRPDNPGDNPSRPDSPGRP
jgi:hypothetical protein